MSAEAFEWISAAVSAAAVWLVARRSLLGIPIGLLSVVLYAGIFIEAKLYSDALLQCIFAGFIIYGWCKWKANLGDDGLVKVAPLERKTLLRDLAIGASAALLLGAVMHQTDAALPWLDAALTAFSLIAQWWQSRRHVAAWWLWITVDVVYVGLYWQKSLNVTAVLYIGFVAIAVMGLRKWQQAESANALKAS